MSEFIVKEPKQIPYFDHDGRSVLKTIKTSGKRRGMSPIGFAIRKIKIIICGKIGYSSSLNKVRVSMNRRRGVNIGNNVYIGMRTNIDNAYPEYVYIEDNVSIAGNVMIIAHSNPYPHFRNVVESSVEPVVIKKGAWIGSGAIILRGVTIGENAIVSAGSVVDKDVPSCSLVKGNPMKIVAEFESLIED